MSNTPVTDDILFRGQILLNSLVFESMTSYFISELLGIEDYKNSKTLGNKSSSLSFSQRVDLLLDLKAFSSDQRKKLQTFMEIRNQLMHNIEASSYEKCFSFMKGKDNWILKEYPQPNELSREKKLEKATISLAQGAYDIIEGLIKPLNEKKEKKKEVPYLKRLIDARDKAINDIEGIVDDLIAKKIGEDKSIKIDLFKNMGKTVSDLVGARIKFHRLQELEQLRTKTNE